MLRIKQEALTLTTFYSVPAHSTVLPNTANLSTQLTKEIRLNIPMLSAAMDTVTETKLAISLATRRWHRLYSQKYDDRTPSGSCS